MPQYPPKTKTLIDFARQAETSGVLTSLYYRLYDQILEARTRAKIELKTSGVK